MFDSIRDSSEPSGPDDAGPRERMGLMRRLAEIGLRMAERLERQSELSAVYAETCAVPEHLQPPYARRMDEIARAFAQVCRAVALAVALEDRIDADRRAGPAAAAERAMRRQLLALRVQAAEAGSPATAAQGADPAQSRSPDPAAPAASELRPRLDRLFDGGLAELDAWLRHPAEQVVARIRRDLGLAPDGGGPGAPMAGPSLSNDREAHTGPAGRAPRHPPGPGGGRARRAAVIGASPAGRSVPSPFSEERARDPQPAQGRPPPAPA